MALDRFVNWGDNHPTRDQIESVLTHYFGGAARVEWKIDRFFVWLPGNSSFPFVGLGNRFEAHEVEKFAENPERLIEVWVDATGRVMDVITRQADHYTNGIAEQLAATFARYWGGVRED